MEQHNAQVALMQHRLMERLIQSGAEPFHGLELTREDTVWLIARMDEDIERTDPREKAAKYLNFRSATFQKQADLRDLCLQYACFDQATLPGVKFNRSVLSGATFERAHLEDANFTEATLVDIHANRAVLPGAYLIHANLRGADLQFACLDGADFHSADLSGANLAGVSQMSGTDFRKAHFEGANLERAHFEGRRADDGSLMVGADLRGAFFDSATNLDGATLFAPGYQGALIADARWGDANLAQISLDSRLSYHAAILGDEWNISTAQQSQQRKRLLNEAVRANRQMALALSSQGLKEVSFYFAYRAQRCERSVQRNERRWGNYLFSLLLDQIAGYGYRLRRVVVTYFAILAVFMLVYLFVGLTFGDAVLTSFTALHGRVFSSDATGTAREWIAAVEALFGLGIESVVVALILQRFFNK